VRLEEADGGGEIGLPLAVAMLPSVTATSRGRNGCGGVRHPYLYSLKALRIRKGEDWARIRSVAMKESDDGVDLRRKTALTCGPMMSATGMKENARVR
jgi:hypothetical protein